MQFAPGLRIGVLGGTGKDALPVQPAKDVLLQLAMVVLGFVFVKGQGLPQAVVHDQSRGRPGKTCLVPAHPILHTLPRIGGALLVETDRGFGMVQVFVFFTLSANWTSPPSDAARSGIVADLHQLAVDER